MFNGIISPRSFSSPLRVMIVLVTLLGSIGSPKNAHALGIAIKVNTIADNTTEDGLCSLREAITNANINWQFYEDCDMGFSDDGIFFSDALGTATITLTSALPPVKDPAGLVIDGGHDITVSGGNLYQVFSVTQIGQLTLDSLTVKNGNSQITNIGGAVINNGDLVVTNSTFRDNYAQAGGAIFNGIRTVTITNTSFQNNKASEGGGIYNEGGQITIQDGSFSGNSAVEGGAIKNVFTPGVLGTRLSINGTSFTENISKYGAGIYNTESAQLNIANASFLKNNGGHAGGGIYNLGYLNVTFSDISGNIAESGGGIYNENSDEGAIVRITNSNFLRNGSALGAGIYNNKSNLRISYGSISENIGIGLYNYGGRVNIVGGTFSANQGYGIYNYGNESQAIFAFMRIEGSNVSNNSGVGIYNDFTQINVFTTTFMKNGSSGVYSIKNSVITIDKSSFVSNNGKYGGGIYNDHSILNVHNVTLYGNTALQGGGMYNNGQTYIRNSTFSNNSAGMYDGLYNDSSGDLELYNTIIAKSAGQGIDCTNAPGGMITGNNNLIQSTGSAACDFIDGVNNNIIGLEPNFGPLTGSPAYLPIGSTSPALDRGDDIQCAAVLNQSQNGVARPQGAHCDIGSFEQPQSSLARSPQELAAELGIEINTLVEAKALSEENGKNLTSIMDAFVVTADEGDTALGIETLNGFIDQTNTFFKSGELDEANAQLLIDKADTIINDLNEGIPVEK